MFVKNLDPFVTDAKLEKIFGKFGRIHSSKIAKDDNGNSKGFGFVQFDSEESANDALTALDGTTFEGKIMYVSKLFLCFFSVCHANSLLQFLLFIKPHLQISIYVHGF